MKHQLVVAALMSGSAWFGVAAQENKPAVEYVDTSAIDLSPYGPMQARAVLADTSGFAYAVLPAGSKQTPHHHDQEQITLNLSGTFTMDVGGSPQVLHSKAVMVPSNVEHPITAATDEAPVMMEYQPILRPDWLPPHPRFTSPQSASLATLAPGEPMVADFDPASPGWQAETSGARIKRLVGKTVRATFIDLSAQGATFTVTGAPAARERLVYVIDGRLSSRVGSAGRDAGKGMLMIVRPTAKEVRLASVGAPHTVVVMFEAM